MNAIRLIIPRSMGYRPSASENGRGLATGAVREIVRVAFEELGPHRVQAVPAC